MARKHALMLDEAELQGLFELLSQLRNDAALKPQNTHSQYYQAIMMRAMLDGLTQRIDARLDQLRKKGNP